MKRQDSDCESSCISGYVEEHWLWSE